MACKTKRFSRKWAPLERCCADVQVDLNTIDWGPVAPGFTFTRKLTLTNTSKITMAYTWSVPEDSIDPTKAIFKVSLRSLLRQGLLFCYQAGAFNADVCLTAPMCGRRCCYWYIANASSPIHFSIT